MTPCTAREICAAVGGTLLQDSGAPVTGVTTDSRAVQPGQLFIPLVGERFDGHTYISKALEGGAAGCLTAAAPETLLPGKLYIQVADTRLALKALASWYRDKFDLPVVQVTGSAGKTTTKEMIASVLSQRYNTLRTEGNFNNDIGAPLTLLRLMPEHQAAVIETGMNHFGEIRYLGEMVRPDIAVITNVGDAHIENLGNTRQGILRAKCEIFENLTPEGIAVLNGDDELLNTVTLPQTILRCGVDDGCGVRVTDIDDRGLEGVACTVTIEGEHYRLTTSAPGRYMIYPMAMAAAIGRRLGLTGEEIAAGRQPRPTPGGGAGRHGRAGTADGAGAPGHGRADPPAGTHRRGGGREDARPDGDGSAGTVVRHSGGGHARHTAAVHAGHGGAGEGLPRHAL